MLNLSFISFVVITMASTSETATIARDSWLRSFMDKYVLSADGSNFKDWEEQLRLAAAGDGKLRYLVDPSPPSPNTRATADVRDAFSNYQKESAAVKNVLFFSMHPALQRQCVKFRDAHEVFSRLSTMFSQAPRIIQYDTAVRFFEANLNDGQPVSSHVLKLIEYVETLEGLGCKIPDELVVDRVLHSLSHVKGFTQFRVNYNMTNMRKSLHELHSLLVQAEKDMGLSGSTRKDVLAINVKGKKQFKRNAGKKPIQVEGKGKAIANCSTKPKLLKGNPLKDTCNYCNNKGHWRRNCTKYLDDIKAGIVKPTWPKKHKKAK
ncbi:uncharacterized protein LOC141611516 [Silene latifolia]|uniref:uncharacterized protein LOC141611516 n=1 Tax=Silene latifolia TaxID=37657 RepID=UPI003D77F993